MSKLVVFDVDGTFLNSFGVYLRVVEEYSREKGMPIPCLETIKRGYGQPSVHDFKWGVPLEEQVHHMRETFKIVDHHTRNRNPEYFPDLFDGVEETMEHLKDTGHTLAIVTAKPEEPLKHTLDHYGLEKWFSAIRSYTDVERRKEAAKPAPDQLLSVMKELKAAPEETVMVGDTTMDVLMGKNAKTRTVGVTWGCHTAEDLEKAGACRLVDTAFPDVAEVVRKIF